ncbi:hypothetical protein D3C78_1804130 [compost metagenome]
MNIANDDGIAQLRNKNVAVAMQVKLLLPFYAVRKIYARLLLEAKLLHKPVHAGEIQRHAVFFTGNQLVDCLL